MVTRSTTKQAKQPANQVLTHPRLPGVTVELVEITPEYAQTEILDKMTPNQRSLSDATVNQYAGDMEADEWYFSSQNAFDFNERDQAMNGQHRAHAIIKSGTSQVFLVVRGLEEVVADVMDGGRPRSFGDHLKQRKVANHSSVAALTKRALYWQLGNYADRSAARQADAPFLHSKLSVRMLLTFWEAHEAEVANEVLVGKSLGNWAGKDTCTPSVFAFTHMLLNRLDPYFCEEFFKDLQNDVPTDAVRVLQKRIFEVGRKRDNISEITWMHWIFGTWNRFLNNQTQGPLRPPLPGRWDLLNMPMDPNSDSREEEWQPL